MERNFHQQYKITSLKFWQNFWEYYKIHILIILVVAIVAFVGIRSCALKVKEDLRVNYVGGILLQRPEEFQAKLESFTTDLDGDGKVTVRLANEVVRPEEDSEQAYVIFARIDAELMGGDPFIVLTDETFVGRFVNDSAFEPIDELVEDVPEEYIKRDPKTGKAIAVNVGKLPIAKVMGVIKDGDVYAGMKVMPRAKQAKEMYVKMHEQTKAVMKKMIEYK